MFIVSLLGHLGEFTATAGEDGVNKYKTSQTYRKTFIPKNSISFLEKLFFIGNEWSPKF